jgi:hypothetical protein
MRFFIDYWPVIVAFICGAVVALLLAVKFSKEPTERKIEMIKQWLLFAVIQAEKELGGGTGQVKLRYVWDMFIKTFPVLAPLVPFDVFSKLVDDALDQMRHLLETNMDVLYYVEGNDGK